MLGMWMLKLKAKTGMEGKLGKAGKVGIRRSGKSKPGIGICKLGRPGMRPLIALMRAFMTRSRTLRTPVIIC